MNAAEEKRKTCGVVMPISATDGCAESHWSEVFSIISDASDHAGFSASLVSSADEVSVIQKRIVQNLYHNPIVVCDVSGRNANVMFELGMRLAFDKPTIVVKDDKTPFSFDTAPIEHLEYPRDLRFQKIVDFKQKLSEKIRLTVDASTNDASYSTFLKSFGQFVVARLDEKEVSTQQYVIEELRSLRAAVENVEHLSRVRLPMAPRSPAINFRATGLDDKQVGDVIKIASGTAGVRSAIHYRIDDEPSISVRLSDEADRDAIRLYLTGVIKAAQSVNKDSRD